MSVSNLASSGTANPLASLIEHTLLAPTATRVMIDRHCAEARTHELFAVCVNPVWVARACDLLRETPVRVVAVVGFPLGATTSAAKAFESELAVRHGVHEIDMVIQLGALKAADRYSVREDIAAVVKAAAGRAVKVILETALLNDYEKRLGCELAEEAGAAFVKTSTGFATPQQLAPGVLHTGATVSDVRLLRQIVGDRMRIKASGGIREAEFARELVAAGADRIGTSVGPGLLGK
jgi:deoxyribose-phosphate aldolase